ncbi:hypothetical protein IPL68_00240 [Candidatus Saccharibacteria bacterium]|nr:MAG: hypothetical protein IPL68_00240 [Candidatus Saccharibacteria bacterium]
MRFLVVTAIVGTFAYLPVWAFDSLVLPQLSGLQQTYQAAADLADRTNQ